MPFPFVSLTIGWPGLGVCELDKSIIAFSTSGIN